MLFVKVAATSGEAPRERKNAANAAFQAQSRQARARHQHGRPQDFSKHVFRCGEQDRRRRAIHSEGETDRTFGKDGVPDRMGRTRKRDDLIQVIDYTTFIVFM